MGTDRFDELVRCEVEWGPLTSNALTVVKPHRFVASTRVTKRHRPTSQTRQCNATASRERTWAQIECMTSSGWRDFDGSGVRREPRSTVVLSTHLLHPRQMTMRNVEHAAHRHVSGSCRERHAPESLSRYSPSLKMNFGPCGRLDRLSSSLFGKVSNESHTRRVVPA